MGNEKEKQGFYMINRRIGSTIYRVRVYGSETATEASVYKGYKQD